MKTHLLRACLPLLVGVGCTPDQEAKSASLSSPDAGAAAPADGGPLPDAATLPDAGPVTAANVVPRSAQAICAGLFRCCDGAEQVRYFADYQAPPGQDDSPLAPFRDRIPPAVTLDQPGCVTVLSEMLEVVWLGQWAQQARDGLVTFEPAQTETCFQQLAAAPCGQALVEALYDDRCLSKSRSSTGPDGQRRMFTRTRANGATCRPAADGFGGLIYGSCDPTTSFCCVPDPSLENRCSPFGLPGNVGTCQAAGGNGATCSLVPLLACATGSSCDGSDRCVTDSTVPLGPGDACYRGTSLTGNCVDSYCDLFGDGNCHALKDNGQSCGAPGECVSGACESNLCAEYSTCTGPP
jgi:hypothetical protein